MRTLHEVPVLNLDSLPFDLCVYQHNYHAHDRTVLHSHPWGQLDSVSKGVMHLEIDGRRFLSPPQYAVWIPPDARHSCFSTCETTYRSIYLSPDLSGRLPPTPCSLSLSAIATAIVADLITRSVRIPESDTDRRLIAVLADQIAAAPTADAFLPYSNSPALERILETMRTNPGDNRSIAEWASSANMTERTLARLCQRELGMSLGQWRQRLRFLSALDALDNHHEINEIAFDLGYGAASAFITAFRQMSGMTPGQYRTRVLGAPAHEPDSGRHS